MVPDLVPSVHGSGSLTFSHGAQHQDARFLEDPVRWEQRLTQDRNDDLQQVVVEHIGKDIQSCGRTFP